MDSSRSRHDLEREGTFSINEEPEYNRTKTYLVEEDDLNVKQPQKTSKQASNTQKIPTQAKSPRIKSTNTKTAPKPRKARGYEWLDNSYPPRNVVVRSPRPTSPKSIAKTNSKPKESDTSQSVPGYFIPFKEPHLNQERVRPRVKQTSLLSPKLERLSSTTKENQTSKQIRQNKVIHKRRQNDVRVTFNDDVDDESPPDKFLSRATRNKALELSNQRLKLVSDDEDGESVDSASSVNSIYAFSVATPRDIQPDKTFANSGFKAETHKIPGSSFISTTSSELEAQINEVGRANDVVLNKNAKNLEIYQITRDSKISVNGPLTMAVRSQQRPKTNESQATLRVESTGRRPHTSHPYIDTRFANNSYSSEPYRRHDKIVPSKELDVRLPYIKIQNNSESPPSLPPKMVNRTTSMVDNQAYLPSPKIKTLHTTEVQTDLDLLSTSNDKPENVKPVVERFSEESQTDPIEETPQNYVETSSSSIQTDDVEIKDQVEVNSIEIQTQTLSVASIAIQHDSGGHIVQYPDTSQTSVNSENDTLQRPKCDEHAVGPENSNAEKTLIEESSNVQNVDDSGTDKTQTEHKNSNDIKIETTVAETIQHRYVDDERYEEVLVGEPKSADDTTATSTTVDDGAQIHDENASKDNKKTVIESSYHQDSEGQGTDTKKTTANDSDVEETKAIVIPKYKNDEQDRTQSNVTEIIQNQISPDDIADSTMTHESEGGNIDTTKVGENGKSDTDKIEDGNNKENHQDETCQSVSENNHQKRETQDALQTDIVSSNTENPEKENDGKVNSNSHTKDEDKENFDDHINSSSKDLESVTTEVAETANETANTVNEETEQVGANNSDVDKTDDPSKNIEQIGLSDAHDSGINLPTDISDSNDDSTSKNHDELKLASDTNDKTFTESGIDIGMTANDDNVEEGTVTKNIEKPSEKVNGSKSAAMDISTDPNDSKLPLTETMEANTTHVEERNDVEICSDIPGPSSDDTIETPVIEEVVYNGDEVKKPSSQSRIDNTDQQPRSTELSSQPVDITVKMKNAAVRRQSLDGSKEKDNLNNDKRLTDRRSSLQLSSSGIESKSNKKNKDGITSLEKDTINILQTIQSIQEDSKRIQAENKQLQDDNHRISGELVNITARFDKFVSESKEREGLYKKSNERHKSEKEKLAIDFFNLRKENMKLEDRVDNLKKEKGAIQEDIQHKEDTLDAVLKGTQEMKKKNDLLEDEIKTLVAQMKKMQANYNNSKTNEIRYENIGTPSLETRALKKELEDLRDDNVNLQESLDAEMKKRQLAQNVLDDVIHTNEGFRKEVSKLRHKDVKVNSIAHQLEGLQQSHRKLIDENSKVRDLIEGTSPPSTNRTSNLKLESSGREKFLIEKLRESEQRAAISNRRIRDLEGLLGDIYQNEEMKAPIRKIATTRETPITTFPQLDTSSKKPKVVKKITVDPKVYNSYVRLAKERGRLRGPVKN